MGDGHCFLRRAINPPGELANHFGLIVIPRGNRSKNLRKGSGNVDTEWEIRKAANNQDLREFPPCSSLFICVANEDVSFVFLLFFHPRPTYCFEYIRHGICAIASSTRPIPSEGWTNASQHSSSGLHLTLLCTMLFLPIMKAAQHVSSFIYRFPYHFYSGSWRSCSRYPVHFLHFAIFNVLRGNSVGSRAPIIHHRRACRLSFFATDEQTRFRVS